MGTRIMHPVNAKHLYNILSNVTLGRRYTDVIQMFCVYWQDVPSINIFNSTIILADMKKSLGILG